MAFKPVLDADQRKAVVVDYEDGFTPLQLAKRYSVSSQTIFRILREFDAPRMVGNKQKKRKKPDPKVGLQPIFVTSRTKRLPMRHV